MGKMKNMDEELWWIPLGINFRASSQIRQLCSRFETKIDLKTEYNFLESSSNSSSSSSSAGDGGGDSTRSLGSGGNGGVLGMGNAAGFVLSKGAGFAGQVFGLYSTTRSCLVGIEEKKRLRFPFSCTLIRRFVHGGDSGKSFTGPAFNFYTNQDDARAYLRRLKVPEMEVASVPLHMAYKFFRERPSLFNFVPAKRQVEFAKEILKRAQGRNAAQQFKGVPVFSSENLSVLVVGPNGARWFRPYFFKKEELDGIIKTSMDHHYQTLIRNRAALRHNQLGDFPSDMADDFDMLEAQDMQDFMEDDEWSSVLESIVAKAAQICIQDTLDKAIFGNKWCRMIAGVQPKFPILVDSFEQRAIMDHQSEKRPATNLSGQKPRSLLSRIRIRQEQAGEEELYYKPPQLTVVAGVAGSSVDQVMKVATTAIQEAKDRIDKNEMQLEKLFIADLGGPHLWSTPAAAT